MILTRVQLRKDLQQLGFTYRESRALVNVIIKVLINKLKTDGELEMPFGKMTLKEPKPKRVYRLGKIVTINTKRKVHYRSIGG